MLSQAPKLLCVRQRVISQALLGYVMYEYSMGFSDVGCLVIGDADRPLKNSTKKKGENYIIKIKIHSSCEIEDVVETHPCELCVILRSRVLRVVCPH